MATRAQIIFTDEKITSPKRFLMGDNVAKYPIIYKHFDGYPEEVLPQLQSFCEVFDKNRGLSDVPYAIARCLFYWLALSFDGENPKDLTTWGTYDFLSYGIDNELHGDISYFYIVDCKEKKIYCIDWNKETKEIITLQ